MSYIRILRATVPASLAAAGGASHALPPQEPSFSQLWALNYTGGPVYLALLDANGTCPNSNTITGLSGAGIGAPQGWSLFAPSGQEVVIAVLDSGIDMQHPPPGTTGAGRHTRRCHQVRQVFHRTARVMQVKTSAPTKGNRHSAWIRNSASIAETSIKEVHERAL